MSGFKEVLLGEICKIDIGGTPSRSKDNYWWKSMNDGPSFPWVSISDMNTKVINQTKEYITQSGIDNSNCKFVSKGTLLMSFKLSIGKLAFAGRDLYTNEAIAAINTGNEVSSEFLYYGLQHWNLTGDIDQAVKGVTLNKQKLHQIPCLIPSLPEQKKIAEILSGIDRLITITQTHIFKQENIKNGLLSSLIGNLPLKIKLDDVAKRVSGHTPSKSNNDYWNGGISWVSLTDTSKLDKRYISETSKEISNLGIENSSAVLHPAGTVIISRDARVGCSAVTTKSMAISQHFIGWICSENLHNMFLYYCLQHWKSRFERIAMGSTIPTIGVSFFKDLMISLPPINDQKNIAKSLESIDNSIQSLINQIQFFENLKKGLMADLLSGRKRVNVK